MIGGSLRRTSRQLLRRGLAALLPRWAFIVSGPRRSRQVCLTFDDGPDFAHTPRVLEVLREYRVAATFFLLGKQAAAYPQLVRQIAAEGHTIANHTYTHRPAEQLSAREFRDEALRTQRLLGELLGMPPRLLRPPYGKLSFGKLSHTWLSGHTVVLWNNDPKDFASTAAEPIRDWFRTHPLEGGQIVLLHDCCPHLSDVLPDLIADARNRGLEFTTLDAWVRTPFR
ncbi:MAG TPA: polysaccharide deacetylase family protein [Pirellulales bacterium]